MILSVKNKRTIIDPVCGMAVTPGAKTIFSCVDGDKYYFCAEGCRQSFEKNPQKFINPKSKIKKGLWGRYLERLEKASGGRAMKCH